MQHQKILITTKGSEKLKQNPVATKTVQRDFTCSDLLIAVGFLNVFHMVP